MKRIFIVIMACVALLVVGVQNAEAQQRTAEQIRNIVENSPLRGRISNFESSKAKRFAGSNAGQAQTDAEPFYVFGADDGEGFVIVSGDERMAPVLAYSVSGSFDMAAMPDNVRAWLGLYEKEFSMLQSGKAAKSQSLRADEGQPVGELSGAVEPFMKSQWGQNAPYNNLCPDYATNTRAVTGCGATAMAQCMYYYRYPSAGTGSHSYVTETHGLSQSWDYDAHPLQWGLMKDTYTSTGNTAEQVKAIAELMYGCGVAVDMDYDEESGSFHGDVMRALHSYYGYDEDMTIIKMECMPALKWHEALISELNAKHPLLISAHTVTHAGHMFLVHGYKTDGTDSPYYYVNWGWSGGYDGYFKMPDLNYDGDESNAFSQDISAIIGIKPDNGVKESTLTMQVKTITPNATKVDVTKGEKLRLSVDGLVMGNITDFQGTIKMMLFDDDDNAYVVNTTPEWTIETGKGYSYSAECTLPGAIGSGVYTLRCFVRKSGSGTDVEVSVGNAPISIEIVNDENVYIPSMETAEVSVSTSGDRNVTVKGTNIMNASDIPFSGTLQILLTDYFNNNILTFGSTKTLSNLGEFAYYPRTDSFSGTLPATVADGAYRIWIGAQQSGYEQWGRVTKYVVEGGYITQLDQDASTPMWVVGGKVTLEAPHSTVTFRIGDEIVSQESLVVGEPIGIPDAPDMEGYLFNGWGEVPAAVPMTDVVVNGSYTINQYKVKFVADGVVIQETTQDYGTAITAPEAPAKEGYTFSGWGEVAATVPAKNVEYTAQYTANTYHLSFVVDGKAVLEMDTDYGSAILKPKSPSKEGHTFDGWDNYPETMPAHDVVCTAKFKINQYNVVFTADGKVVSETKMDYGTAITAPEAPAKEGHTFSGWGEVDATVPARDVEYKAQYTVNQYTLRYVVDGAEYKSETLDFGEAITTAAAPTKPGFTFSGWSSIPATMPAHDVTVTGTFADNPHTIVFKIDGEVYSTSVLSYGASITVPEVPDREGYTFSGWGDVVKTMPDNDLEYTAQFNVNSYTLTYLVDGKVYNTYTVEYGTEITPEGNPEDDDFFYAWEDVPATMPARNVEVNAYITGLAGWMAASNTKIQIFTLSGERINTLQKGVNIIRTADGKRHKVLVR
ncbi:MAG: C10 family peptidase [Bacteroidaceae bacterium]|nr:C10 family peptidase [Bacteroidaceae bacterium]